MSGRYLVKTLGCKANLYDSQLLEAELQKRGWAPFHGPSGSGENEDGSLLCIVNSCTVTDEADRQTRKLASRFSREHPGATVVVTGCGAEVDPERLANSKGIHYVVSNRDKPALVDLILNKLEEKPFTLGEQEGQVLGSATGYGEMISRHPIDREWPDVSESFSVPPVGLEGTSRKTRVFLKIQEGCNSFCTYCIIPYGRGPSRSLRPRGLLEQVRALIGQGIREVVITGTNIGDYGVDWGAGVPGEELARLVDLILDETGLERLRVSSLDPTEITPALIARMERDSRFCPHFHVSLQSPHSRILRLMKRKYGFEQAKSCLERIASIPAPAGGPFVGMDVITGFPGETEEEFDWTCKTLSDLPWSRLHVFPYSERSGTPAVRLPGSVPQSERVRRTRVLNALSLDRMRAIHSRVVAEAQRKSLILKDILTEHTPKGPLGFASVDGSRWISGYTSNYLRVFVPFSESEKLPTNNQKISAAPVDFGVDLQSGDAWVIGNSNHRVI